MTSTPTLSFEVFPPKTADGLDDLRSTVLQLADADPAYVSVTYGAGGSDRARSFDTVATVAATGLDVSAHLTCVGQSRADIESVLQTYRRLGVQRIVALRGDPPTGIDGAYQPHPDGFTSTDELVAAVSSHGFPVSVSAYPERHPQSPSLGHDLDVLAAKVEAGATEAITQMFFDNDQFLSYLEQVRARGIHVPIVAGIFPIHSFPAVSRFAARCGAAVPPRIAERFAGLDDDRETTHKIAAELAADQITELHDCGVDRFHVYTLNRPELALAVHEQLTA